jgi:hypothetical protein
MVVRSVWPFLPHRLQPSPPLLQQASGMSDLDQPMTAEPALASSSTLPPPIDDGHPFDLAAVGGQFDGPSAPSSLRASPGRRPEMATRPDLDRKARDRERRTDSDGRRIVILADRALLVRLAHIASACPSLLPACAALALPVIRSETYDLGLYDFFGGPSDDPWRAEAAAKSAEEMERLEAELKSVTANLIKESIRVRRSPVPTAARPRPPPSSLGTLADPLSSTAHHLRPVLG